MATIKLEGVNKRFGADSLAVDNLNLTIEDGSFSTLLGPSGCGKTTTLRMIAGLESPTSGEIRIGERPVYSSPRGIYVSPSKRELGLVFQSYALWPHMTVFENIAFGLQVEKVSRGDTKKRADAVATVLQIEELLQRYPNELSGGQQQRVAIARVLVMEPELILLDEPLSNLDAALRMDMRVELKRLHTEMSATIIYVTHDQIEALTMSTHIALMNKGVLQQYASPMELYNAPLNTFTADFIGSPRINLLQGVVEADGGRHVVCDSGLRVPLASGVRAEQRQRVSLGLRAEDFTVSKNQEPDLVEATVYSVLPTGPEWYLQVVVGAKHLTVRVQQDLGVGIDDSVWIGAIPERAKCFDESGRLLAATANG